MTRKKAADQFLEAQALLKPVSVERASVEQTFRNQIGLEPINFMQHYSWAFRSMFAIGSLLQCLLIGAEQRDGYASVKTRNGKTYK